MEPIFLLSLPRSGSTLLQRLLASHPEIATTSEPWILLPLIYSFREKGVIAEYEHHNLARAMNDFCVQLPNGKDDCYAEMKEMVMRLYLKISGEATYFLDKTPRYHLIADEIIQMFPNCKIIILWRNPLAVAASMIETWGAGNWNLHWFHIDLYNGVENLTSFYKKNKRNIYSLSFENFVSKPDFFISEIFKYLGLSDNHKATEQFSKVNLNGRMGDPTGIKRYTSVSDKSLNKWKRTLSNPLRRLWARHYLQWIGEKRLSLMGYSKTQLISELGQETLSVNRVFSDILRIGYNYIYRFLNKHIFKKLQ